MAEDNARGLPIIKTILYFCFFPPVCPYLPCPLKCLVEQDRPPSLFSKNLAVLVSALPEHSRARWMFMAVAVVFNTREIY